MHEILGAGLGILRPDLDDVRWISPKRRGLGPKRLDLAQSAWT